jgi:hypothetical protein
VRIAPSGRLHAREEGLHLFVEHTKPTPQAISCLAAFRSSTAVAIATG